jgi:hypothetical protein
MKWRRVSSDARRRGGTMRVTPIKSFPHDRRGKMLAGRAYDLPEDEAARLIRIGLVRIASPDEYDTKVVVQTPILPSQAVGEAQPSSASPAAQVSAQTIARPSEGGKRKKKKNRPGR